MGKKEGKRLEVALVLAAEHRVDLGEVVGARPQVVLGAGRGVGRGVVVVLSVLEARSESETAMGRVQQRSIGRTLSAETNSSQGTTLMEAMRSLSWSFSAKSAGELTTLKAKKEAAAPEPYA